MPERERGFKACYRHPGRAALAGCSRCGKPICSQCLKESMEAGLCPECASARYAAFTEQRALELAEITVDELEDGVEEGGPPSTGAELSGPGESQDSTAVPAPAGDGQERAAPEGEGYAFSSEPFPSNWPRQMARGAVYGLLAGAFTFFIWTVLASLRHQWTQISVLTAGMIIPWALFKGTTSKKRLGVPVYRKSPPAALMGAASLLLFAALTLSAFLVASKVVYLEGSPASLRAFASRYFRPVDVVLVVLGFLSALGVPFFLKLGEPP